MRRGTRALAAGVWAALAGSAWALPAAPVHYAVAGRTPVGMTLTGVLTVDGLSAPAGSEVAAFDPQGVPCGASGVDPANGGAFVLHVYGDDPTTAGDEGARQGDTLRLEVRDPGGRVFTTGALGFLDAGFGRSPDQVPPLFVDRESRSLRIAAVSDAGAHRPSQPEILSLTPVPADPLAAFQVALTPFSDPDEPGGVPAAVEWSVLSGDLSGPEVGRVARKAGALATSVRFPPTLLKGEGRYQFQVRYRDSAGLDSEWSVPRPVTLQRDPRDSDNDGFEDRADVRPSAAPLAWTFSEAQSGQKRRVEVQLESGTLGALQAQSAAELPLAGPLEPRVAPYGWFSFRVEGLPVTPTGATVRVAFELPEALPATPAPRWYKVGVDGALEDYSERAVFQGGRVTLTLTDGGAGDADGVINGTVVDPSGLILAEPVVPRPEPPASGGGGGGGCFLGVLGF